MKSITQGERYSPHLLETKYGEVMLFREWKDANCVTYQELHCTGGIKNLTEPKNR